MIKHPEIDYSKWTVVSTRDLRFELNQNDVRKKIDILGKRLCNNIDLYSWGQAFDEMAIVASEVLSE